MIIEQTIVGLVVVTLVVMLIWGHYPVAALFSSAAFLFYVLGFISFEVMASQVANPGLVAVILLMLLSVTLNKVPLLERWTHRIIRGTYRMALLKLVAVVGLQSAFLNNTAVVASLIGPLRAAAKEQARRLLLPLTYAATLGGVTTLIGTSTNLLVSGFVTEAGLPALGILAPLPLGLVLFAGAAIAMVVFYPRILKPAPVEESNQQPYFVEAIVQPDSPLAERTVEENQLRNLVELYLVEIIRSDKLIAPVRPEQTIRAGDVLVFAGDVTRLDLLTRFPGLTMLQHDGIPTANLLEVMISPESMLINRTIRDVDFRAQFDAGVVAVRRHGERFHKQLGNLPLRAGDVLVLATGRDFDSRNNLQRNFITISRPIIGKFVHAWQSVLALGGFLAVIVSAAAGMVDLIKGLLCLLVVFLATGLVKASDLRSNFPWQLTFTIASALIISQVLGTSGLAASVAQGILIALDDPSPWLAVTVILLGTAMLTELMTNNAAAALMFPIALGVSTSMGVSHMPFVMAVVYGASASFLTPYGYQTNLMVMSPGGYRVSDYLRAGAPISIVYLGLAVVLIPRFFPF